MNMELMTVIHAGTGASGICVVPNSTPGTSPNR